MSNRVLSSAVMRVLNDPVTGQINFVMGGYEFRPDLYQQVRSAVANDRIEVDANPNLGRTAYYQSNGDHLWLVCRTNICGWIQWGFMNANG